MQITHLTELGSDLQLRYMPWWNQPYKLNADVAVFAICYLYTSTVWFKRNCNCNWYHLTSSQCHLIITVISAFQPCSKIGSFFCCTSTFFQPYISVLLLSVLECIFGFGFAFANLDELAASQLAALLHVLRKLRNDQLSYMCSIQT